MMTRRRIISYGLNAQPGEAFNERGSALYARRMYVVRSTVLRQNSFDSISWTADKMCVPAAHGNTTQRSLRWMDDG